ncbi:MAG: ribosome small subunit-dependent GTPase A [Spirochaetota bacterium]
MQELTGTVVQGINNIFLVEIDHDTVLQCRIKGKVLADSQMEYNPLAPGDRVAVAAHTSTEGNIIERLERKSVFTRWNMKRNSSQNLAANIDLVLCMCSAAQPTFRPRFIDRVSVCAGRQLPVTVIVNKADLGISVQTQSYIDYLLSLGFSAFFIDAHTPETFAFQQLRDHLENKVSVIVGLSGVGKSTLVNQLLEGGEQKVAAISDRYDRGKHTTNYAKLLHGGSFDVIDTPGVREIEIPLQDPLLIGEAFPEILEKSSNCRFSGCLHLEEPGCAVREALQSDPIGRERYESYVKLVYSMIERRKAFHYGV